MFTIFDHRKNFPPATIVVGAVLLYWALQNLQPIWVFLGKSFHLLLPFIIGLSIALILNLPMQALERLLPAKWSSKLRRLISLGLTVLLMLVLILMVLLTIIPEIGRTLETLLAMLPGFVEKVTAWGKQLSAKSPNLGAWLSRMDLNWDNIGNSVFNFLKNSLTNLMNSTINLAKSIFSGVVQFFLGAVFAVYLLLQKENLARQTKRTLSAFLPKPQADHLINLSALVSQTFTKFISGQFTEAVILGLMFFIAMLLFRFPYALVISVLVTFTALIPIFGAFIACVIGALLILVSSPVQAFWFIVLFLALQQIEGNLIYPRVVGRSVGLPPIWVLAAVMIGGGLMGITGMLISVPLCSVFYVLLRELVNERLAKKGLLPDKTT